MNVRAAMNQLFGFSRPEGGNVPGYPDTMVANPYRLERLAWDYPKAMRQVATVRACVLRIANDLAQLPVVFERQSGADWTPLERTPGNIVDVWSKANDEQTSFELVRDLHAHLKASGNAYLVAETFGTKKVHELWLMHPQHVRVVPGPRRKASAYVFNRGGKEEVVQGEYVIHFRGYNPDFEPTGASDLESVENQYSTRHDIGRLMSLFVRGGGIPAGYFKVLGPDGNPAAQAMSDPDQKRLQSSMERLFNGIRNAFRPKILSALQWDRMGLTPKEMNLIEIAALSDGDICRALGVPPWMVGIKEATSLGGSPGAAAADRGIYFANTLKPELAFRDAVLTEKFCPMFELGVRARTDTSGVLEVWAPFLNSAQQSVALTGRPVLTVNELRHVFALPPADEPEADELYTRPDPLAAFGAPAPDPQDSPEAKPAPVEEEKSLRMIDGDEARETRRKKASANLTRYERRVARLFSEILDQQQARIIAKLEADGSLRSHSRAINVDEIVMPDPDDQQALERLLAQLVRDRGEEALADLALELQLNVNSSRAAAFVNSQAQRALSLIDATTREAVRNQIAEGLRLNETTGEIVARIKQMPEFGQSRALMIARTETVSAYNFATIDAYEQSGVVEGVEWLSARDAAVRPSHAEADGDVVPVGTPFSVGGAPLEYPGDPGGPPEETINCRCTTLPVVNEKARARRQFEQTLSRILGGAKKETAQ